VKKLSNAYGILILLFLILISIFAIFNSFTNQQYVSVANKWYEGGKVPVPIDYRINDLRKVDIDLIAPKESNEDGDFFWLQTSGDLITITNRNFVKVKGGILFELEIDPCNISRDILIGTQEKTLLVKTQKNPSPVEFSFNIESNSSIFLSINSLPNDMCQINEELNRKFMAKITNLKVSNLSAS
jgi:hypothetical protein